VIAPWASPPLSFAEVGVDLVPHGHDHIDPVRPEASHASALSPFGRASPHAGMALYAPELFNPG
jgi:hypothetical protein